MQCSYCQIQMQVATVQKKRPVPPGAKDLGLTDQVTCWQCPKCGLTAGISHERCRCGAIVGPEGVPNRVEQVRDQDNILRGCTNCIYCHECHKLIKPSELYTDMVHYHERVAGTYRTGEGVPSSYSVPRTRDDFYHVACYQTKKEREKERERQLELQRQEEHKQMIEARIGDGLCVECGKPLGLMDKMMTRQLHKRCG